MKWRIVLRFGENRASLTDQQMAAIKTAKVYLGKDAVKAGLVDSVGYLSGASKQACQMAGAKRCDLVTYRFDNNVNANTYSPNMMTNGAAPEMSLIRSNLLTPLTEFAARVLLLVSGMILPKGYRQK